MSQKATIEWTDATWNPVRGCSRVSEGCRNCYAERMAARFSGTGQPFEDFAKMTPSGPRWTGKVQLIPKKLMEPLQWRKPRRVFVNSMSDLFHESLSPEDIAAIFGVMAATPKHAYQILTKRPQRMNEFFKWVKTEAELHRDAWVYALHTLYTRAGIPPNVWLGVSVEDQKTADERIPLLLRVPAAVRFLSVEPLLGSIDFTEPQYRGTIVKNSFLHDIDWVIVGSESGPGARPMDEDWVRQIRDQCAGRTDMGRPWPLPFFYKQKSDSRGNKIGTPELDGKRWLEFPRTHMGAAV